jgi:glucose-fructose oxidoreductase
MVKHIGYAVVGLGHVARESVLPAFARATENSRLVAVVSGDRIKAQAVAREYRAAAYHYDELRQCLQRDDVNAVYIALPNSLHCDYAVEAARAGMHVLCEIPMAVVADESRRMIRTCQTNRVKLMLAYRLHFRPGIQKAIEMVRAGDIGVTKTFSSDFTTRVENPDSPRLQRRMGGGTMYHLGAEAINAARTLLGSEPAQVMAMTARTSRRFGGDVDEGAVALIRFPDERLAHLHTSFGEEPEATFTILGEEGSIRVHNAYLENAPITLHVVRHGRTESFSFAPSDAFAATIAYFSDCILNDRAPEPSGVEGLQDVRIVEAIYRSARDGRPVTLPRLARVDNPPAAAPGAALDRRQAG